jgi:hypothetical protein
MRISREPSIVGVAFVRLGNTLMICFVVSFIGDWIFFAGCWLLIRYVGSGSCLSVVVAFFPQRKQTR